VYFAEVQYVVIRSALVQPFYAARNMLARGWNKRFSNYVTYNTLEFAAKLAVFVGVVGLAIKRMIQVIRQTKSRHVKRQKYQKILGLYDAVLATVFLPTVWLCGIMPAKKVWDEARGFMSMLKWVASIGSLFSSSKTDSEQLIDRSINDVEQRLKRATGSSGALPYKGLGFDEKEYVAKKSGGGTTMWSGIRKLWGDDEAATIIEKESNPYYKWAFAMCFAVLLGCVIWYLRQTVWKKSFHRRYERVKKIEKTRQLKWFCTSGKSAHNFTAEDLNGPGMDDPDIIVHVKCPSCHAVTDCTVAEAKYMKSQVCGDCTRLAYEREVDDDSEDDFDPEDEHNDWDEKDLKSEAPSRDATPVPDALNDDENDDYVHVQRMRQKMSPELKKMYDGFRAAQLAEKAKRKAEQKPPKVKPVVVPAAVVPVVVPPVQQTAVASAQVVAVPITSVAPVNCDPVVGNVPPASLVAQAAIVAEVKPVAPVVVAQAAPIVKPLVVEPSLEDQVAKAVEARMAVLQWQKLEEQLKADKAAADEEDAQKKLEDMVAAAAAKLAKQADDAAPKHVCGRCASAHYLAKAGSESYKIMMKNKQCMCGKYCKTNGCTFNHDCTRKDCKYGDKCMWKHAKQQKPKQKQAARMEEPDVCRVAVTNGEAEGWQNAFILKGSRNIRIGVTRHLVEDEKKVEVSTKNPITVILPNNAEVTVQPGKWSVARHPTRDAAYIEIPCNEHQSFPQLKQNKLGKVERGKVMNLALFAYDSFRSPRMSVSSGTGILNGTIIEHMCEARDGNCAGYLTDDGKKIIGIHFGQAGKGAKAVWHAEAMDDDLIQFFTKNL